MARLAALLLAWLTLISIVGLAGDPARATSGDLSIVADTVLSEDHDGEITIDADGVTLDCAGHTVQGPGVVGTGIWVLGHDDVSIVNCDVRDFHIGIHLEDAWRTRIEGNTVSGNPQNGVLLIRGANDSVVTGNTITGNANEGLTVVESTGNLIDGNVIDDSNKGMYVGRSDGNTISNNTVTRGWSWFTIGLGDGSDDNEVIGNRVAFTGIGILVSGSTGNRIARNEASASGTGIGLFAGASGNTVADNYSFSNRDHGFTADVSTGNSFSGNLAHGNEGWGFRDLTSGNTYSENACVGNDLGASDPSGLCDPSGTFADDDASVFQLNIEWLAWEGITKGCNPPTNTRYCPDDYVTRGQMAAFLVRALGYTDDGGGDLFTDDNDSVFETDIDKLGTAGVTKGCNPPTNTRYCPDDYVTRGQMAAFLVRALGYTDDGGGDLFTDDNDSVFETDIDKLGTAGVTKGCNPPTNTRYCPDDYVTRGQMAAFLYRALAGRG